MKSALCKNNNTNKIKKRVSFKDDYENIYFTFLFVFVIISLLYGIYCYTKHIDLI